MNTVYLCGAYAENQKEAHHSLALLDVLFPEQELSVEVRQVNRIQVE